MRLNDYTKHILAEYVKDMYDADMISRYGDYMIAGNAVNRRLCGRGFANFFRNCPLNLEEAVDIEDIASRLDGEVWVTVSVDGRIGSWFWHGRLVQMGDERFLEQKTVRAAEIQILAVGNVEGGQAAGRRNAVRNLTLPAIAEHIKKPELNSGFSYNTNVSASLSSFCR